MSCAKAHSYTVETCVVCERDGFKAELVYWLKYVVLGGGCDCKPDFTCFVCQARKRLPEIYNCANDLYPEVKALVKVEK